jgi:hypothetical protein
MTRFKIAATLLSLASLTACGGMHGQMMVNNQDLPEARPRRCPPRPRAS